MLYFAVLEFLFVLIYIFYFSAEIFHLCVHLTIFYFISFNMFIVAPLKYLSNNFSIWNILGAISVVFFIISLAWVISIFFFAYLENFYCSLDIMNDSLKRPWIRC